MIVLIIAICSSFLAHYLGFTYSMGAFIGGMLIAETHYKHQIEADLILFRDLFLALFFVTVGMHIDTQFFTTHIFQVFGLSIIIMLVKALIIFGIMYCFVGKRVAFETSLAISQVGEFSFVIFTQATQSTLLDGTTGQLLTLSVIISMVLTPFILKNIKSITHKVLKKTDNHIALHDIENITLLSHTVKDLNNQVKILAKVTKKSILPDTINSEDFVDIYDCTAELLVERASI